MTRRRSPPPSSSLALLLLIAAASSASASASSAAAFAEGPPPPLVGTSSSGRRSAVSSFAFAGGKKSTTTTTTTTTTTSLFGLKKGGGGAQRQLELAKKMALAKKQKRGGGGGNGGNDDGGGGEGKDEKGGNDGTTAKLSDEEMKEINDRKRFEDLLNSDRGMIAGSEFDPNNSYLTKSQEEEAANAGYRGVDRIYEGDPAPPEPFEVLVSPDNPSRSIGPKGAKKLYPTDGSKDYLVVVTDPREKSTELRSAVASLIKGLPTTVLEKLVVINPDAAPENRRWIKKIGIPPSVRIYCDEGREWMGEYTALGDKRWSMTMFVIGDGRVQKLVRELDQDLACAQVGNAVKSLNF